MKFFSEEGYQNLSVLDQSGTLYKIKACLIELFKYYHTIHFVKLVLLDMMQ